MALSTSNLLTVVNRVLRACGDRNINALTTPVGERAVDSLAEALNVLQSATSWDWTYERKAADSWVGQEASLGDIRQLLNVFVGDDTLGSRPLRAVILDQLLQTPARAYTGSADAACDYAKSGYNKVYFNPYPNDSASQARIRFLVQNTVVLPTLPTQFLPLPERFIPVLIKKAASTFAVRNTGDEKLARSLQMEYMELLRLLLNERGVKKTRNLYGYNR